MYHIKDDQRSIRSSEMLYDGLARLMHEKLFDSISVTDLVREAQVGRATFYRNFDEIEDVLKLKCDQIFDGLMAYFFEYIQTNVSQINRNYRLIKPLLRYFNDHSDIIELLIVANRLDMVAQALRRILAPFKSQFTSRFDIEDEYVDFGFEMRIGIITNVLVHWIKMGKKQDPDELADRLGTMTEIMLTQKELL